jgi:hypothetical protein
MFLVVLWAALPMAIPDRNPAMGAITAAAFVFPLGLRTAVPLSVSSVVGPEILATWRFEKTSDADRKENSPRLP